MTVVVVGAVLGLALLDMLSPALVGVVTYLLLRRPERVGRLLAGYLGTVALSYFALGVLLMLGLEALLPALDPNVWRWIQGGLGLALFIGSWFIPERRGTGGATPQVRAFTMPSMVLLGLGTWLFEFSTAVPYFASIGLMLAAGAGPSQWLPLLGIYVLIMVLPGIALFAAWTLLRGRLETRLQRWQSKLAASSRSTVSRMIGIAGAVLLLNAVGEVTIGSGP